MRLRGLLQHHTIFTFCEPTTTPASMRYPGFYEERENRRGILMPSRISLSFIREYPSISPIREDPVRKNRDIP
jgi:hypothetical protein